MGTARARARARVRVGRVTAQALCVWAVGASGQLALVYTQPHAYLPARSACKAPALSESALVERIDSYAHTLRFIVF